MYEKGSLLLGSGVVSCVVGVSGVVRVSRVVGVLVVVRVLGVVGVSKSVGSLGVSPVIACRNDLFARSFAMSEAFSWGMGPREVTKHSVFSLSEYSELSGGSGVSGVSRGSVSKMNACIVSSILSMS